MGLTMSQRQAVTKEMALKYKRATKKQKGEILDTLTELTGYNRWYAARVLRQRARYVVVGRGVVKGVKVTLVEDERTKQRKKRNRRRTYGRDVLVALQKVWVICDGICGKRLAPYLAEIAPTLERHQPGDDRPDTRTGTEALPAASPIADQARDATQAPDPDPDI
jgi:hypothetical protein